MEDQDVSMHCSRTKNLCRTWRAMERGGDMLNCIKYRQLPHR
jgi:hypothetical protein